MKSRDKIAINSKIHEKIHKINRQIDKDIKNDLKNLKVNLEVSDLKAEEMKDFKCLFVLHWGTGGSSLLNSDNRT